MDLMAIAARLFLDTGDYESGLSRAEQAAFGFAGQLDQAMALAETAVGAAINALGGELDAGAAQAVASADGAASGVAAAFDALTGASGAWGRDMIANFIDGIVEMWGSLRDTVSGVAQTVKSYLGFSEPEAGPLSNFHTYAPDMMALFAKGITDNEKRVTDAVGGAFDFGSRIAPAAGAGREYAVSRSSENARPVNVIFELDGVQRWVYKLNKAEEQRVGVRLSGVSA